MNERRTSQRIPMKLPIEIRWKTLAGSLKQAMGKTGNISGNGLFIECPVRLHQETSVTTKVVLPREGSQVPIELSCLDNVSGGLSKRDIAFEPATELCIALQGENLPMG